MYFLAQEYERISTVTSICRESFSGVFPIDAMIPSAVSGNGAENDQLAQWISGYPKRQRDKAISVSR